jgi:hypothetical protein
LKQVQTLNSMTLKKSSLEDKLIKFRKVEKISLSDEEKRELLERKLQLEKMLLNKDSKESIEKQIIKTEADSKMLAFTLHTKADYEVNWHHKYVADILDKFANGEIKKLILTMPPQTGKSELSSRRLPAFLLGKNPNARLALCGYSDSFASKFNRDVKRIIESEEYKQIFETRLPNSTSNKLNNNHEFELENGTGSLISVGIGGGLTGNRVDVGIIDDPYKDREQANSPVYRQKVEEWYDYVFDARLHNDSQVLILMTRWHANDLVGRILKSIKKGETRENWTVINLPSIKEDSRNADDKRKIGEALWPERHSIEKLLETKRRSPRSFDALHQGRPQEEKTNKFFRDFSVFSKENPNRNIQQGRINIDMNLPLILSFDFNVSPCSLVLGQKIYGEGVKVIRALQENGGTPGMLKTLNWIRELNLPLMITGDSSGNADKSSALKTDFQYIEEYFRVTVDKVTTKANKSHIYSRELCNHALLNANLLIAEEGCEILIAEMTNAILSSTDGLYKDNDKHRNDAVDAFRYMINYMFQGGISEINNFSQFLKQ